MHGYEIIFEPPFGHCRSKSVGLSQDNGAPLGVGGREDDGVTPTPIRLTSTQPRD